MPSTWNIQRSTRSKGLYCQAVYGSGPSRATATLGYLTEEEASRALVNLRTYGDRLIQRDRSGKLLNLQEIRQAALATSETEIKKAVEAGERKDLNSFERLTLKDFVERVWMPVRSQEAAPKTVQRDRQVWGTIYPVLGDLKLHQLDTSKWTAFLASKETWGGRQRAITQVAYRMALRYAVELGIISEVHAFRPIKGSSVSSKEQVQPLTVEEVRKLLDGCLHPVHRALLALAFGQGLRPGEATALRWEDIDWTAGTVLVRGTKTDKARNTVPMTALTRRELEAFWKTKGLPTTGPAFTWGGAPIKSFKNAIRSAARKAGISRKVTPYVARHTFATIAVASGANQASVRAMMRHSSRSTILERAYERLNPQQMAEGMKSFPSFSL